MEYSDRFYLISHREMLRALTCRCSGELLGLFFVLLALTAHLVEGTDGNTCRISAFVIGCVSPTCNPFTVLFNEDPQFVYEGYPLPYPDAPMAERRRTVRRYYPRTGKDLIDSYDVMVFLEARIEHLTPRHFHDLIYAFREAGMVGAASHGFSWDVAWLPTVLYDLMPVSEYGNLARNVPYRVVFRRERDPIFIPFVELGIEKILGNNYHVMKAREGSLVWADMQPVNLPWLVSWRTGGINAGIMWVFPTCFDAPWWDTVHGSGGRNPHAIDLLTNLLFHSLDMPLINDIHARREARNVLSTFQAEKLLVFHMMEWADSFGANILTLSEKLILVEEEAYEAVVYYIDQDYAATISYMDAMRDKIIRITKDAVRLKNDALFWVYISEWLAVSSVAIISGVFLWTLMVRRKMYRPGKATRLGFAASDEL